MKTTAIGLTTCNKAQTETRDGNAGRIHISDVPPGSLGLVEIKNRTGRGFLILQLPLRKSQEAIFMMECGPGYFFVPLLNLNLDETRVEVYLHENPGWAKALEHERRNMHRRTTVAEALSDVHPITAQVGEWDDQKWDTNRWYALVRWSDWKDEGIDYKTALAETEKVTGQPCALDAFRKMCARFGLGALKAEDKRR